MHNLFKDNKKPRNLISTHLLIKEKGNFHKLPQAASFFCHPPPTNFRMSTGVTVVSVKHNVKQSQFLFLGKLDGLLFIVQDNECIVS